MQITGKCIHVLPIQTGTGKNGEWRKTQFVIETDGEYPKKIMFELFGDKVEKMLPAVGDTLTVHFNMESREYQGKWYSQINAWKIEGFTGNMKAAQQQKKAPTPDAFGDLPKTDVTKSVEDDDSGLPF